MSVFSPTNGAQSLRKVHFLGIAGLLMSSLACIAKARGYEVTGSDENAYEPATTTLANAHINWFNGHRQTNLGTPDLVVLGNHIRRDNPELQEAISNEINILSFPEFLEELFPATKIRVVVAGAHGKSTTSAMIGWILSEAEFDPTLLIGAVSRNFGSSFRKGSDNLLVVEGDEYASSCLDSTPKFLYYHPTHAVLTSVELDHVDLYSTFEKQVTAYAQFCQLVSQDGSMLICTDFPGALSIDKKYFVSRVQSYGLNAQADWLATEIHCGEAASRFAVVYSGEDLGEFLLSVPGRHNVQNALAAIAICSGLGVDLGTIKRALQTFLGVGRRFELIGKVNNIVVIDDYAHHPTAIRTTLEAAKTRYPTSRIICVYEPHTYSRIKGLLDQFAEAFIPADEVIISDIYAAREKSLDGIVHAQDIVNIAREKTKKTHYIASADEVLEYLLSTVQSNDLIIFMSVSRFGRAAEKLVEWLDSPDLEKTSSSKHKF